ncbi:MAG: DUF1156 domain-containing protein [Candidatus Methanofastidiosa archaeon]|nr:DUF1156 domain-containing protein [Candidatus Methanofastidiosa archaeon]
MDKIKDAAINKDRTRAIEDGFPIGFVSQVAEHESWRKEVYRPMSYTHKWWARRLGSVFRAIIISSIASEGEDVAKLFYSDVQYPNITVFDPFLGSGTTVVESIKLGCKSIGRDINPVPVRSLRASLRDCSKKEIDFEFDRISNDAGKQIRDLYTTKETDGTRADVLYYFWVKFVYCPACGNEVELFKSRIFSKHAYPKKNPSAKSVCPNCGSINEIRYDSEDVVCPDCNVAYKPQCGSVSGSVVICPSCQTSFKLLDLVRKSNLPPKQKMYAKMVLNSRGEKEYLSIDDQDINSLQQSKEILEANQEFIPIEEILPGHNTNQILNYNYRYWHQMFNERQLASLTLLVKNIRGIEDRKVREIFTVLFSGVLEFNNMFASFKGEGTGAVRHLFFNHILKPEMMPLEANVWGTKRSSGSFSTLYETRLLRAIEYKERPFELSLIDDGMNGITGSKVFNLSPPISAKVVPIYSQLKDGNNVYLSVGDSAHTDIDDKSVDLVVTDPPFFDNVHYSELADFFFVWQNRIFAENDPHTTRAEGEVQSTDPTAFSKKLTLVFQECHRVLKDNGLLIFTYHHSRPDGWISVYKAVREAGYVLLKAHPVKAEMDVSIPISSSKFPISYDLIIVCKKDPLIGPKNVDIRTTMQSAVNETITKYSSLKKDGLKLSPGDIKVILTGSIMTELSSLGNIRKELDLFDLISDNIDEYVSGIL